MAARNDEPIPLQPVSAEHDEATTDSETLNPGIAASGSPPSNSNGRVTQGSSTSNATTSGRQNANTRSRQPDAAAKISAWGQWMHWKFILRIAGVLLAFAGLMAAALALFPSFRSKELDEQTLDISKWTAWEQYVDKCKKKAELGILSSNCRKALDLDYEDPPPPHSRPDVVTRDLHSLFGKSTLHSFFEASIFLERLLIAASSVLALGTCYLALRYTVPKLVAAVQSSETPFHQAPNEPRQDVYPKRLHVPPAQDVGSRQQKPGIHSSQEEANARRKLAQRAPAFNRLVGLDHSPYRSTIKQYLSGMASKKAKQAFQTSPSFKRASTPMKIPSQATSEQIATSDNARKARPVQDYSWSGAQYEGEDAFEAQQALPHQARRSMWWIPAEGIAREMIEADIQIYLGPDATVQPGLGTGYDASVQGYWITAYNPLTPSMMQDLKSDSQRWSAEWSNESRTHVNRQNYGPGAYAYAYAHIPPAYAEPAPALPRKAYQSVPYYMQPARQSTIGHWQRDPAQHQLPYYPPHQSYTHDLSYGSNTSSYDWQDYANVRARR